MSTQDELLKLLQAERAQVPPSEAVTRGLQRLAGDLAANVPALPIAAGPLKFGFGLFPKFLLLGFGAGLVGAGVASSVAAPRAAAPTIAPSALIHGAQARAPVRAAAVEPSIATPEATVEAPSAVPAARATVTAVAAPNASSVLEPASRATFDAELKLISIAKSELDARRPAKAQMWLSEHAQRFPHGVFATEREALSVLASCERGAKNPTLARSFAAKHPESPLVPRLERACGGGVDSSKSVNAEPVLGERTDEPSKGQP